MQNVAREMNLSETAFLFREGDGFRLRWFTPAVEVDLCGHATLASAHTLWETGYARPEEKVSFHTRSGTLTAERKGDWIEMDFPAKPEEPAAEPEGLAQTLGARIKYLGKNQFDYLVEVDSEEIVRRMKPDFTLLMTLPIRGIIAMCVCLRALKNTKGRCRYLPRPARHPVQRITPFVRSELISPSSSPRSFCSTN